MGSQGPISDPQGPGAQKVSELSGPFLLASPTVGCRLSGVLVVRSMDESSTDAALPRWVAPQASVDAPRLLSGCPTPPRRRW